MVSDKEQHRIWDVYNKHLGYLKNKKVHVLELGVFNGESINYMAENMFTHKDSVIYGVDIRHPIIELDKKAIFINTGQDNPSMFETIKGNLDVIIDDASHDPTLTLNSFDLLWSRVKPGGWYIIEDWHPAVLPEMAKKVIEITERIREQCDDVILWQKDTEPVAAVVLYKKKTKK